MVILNSLSDSSNISVISESASDDGFVSTATIVIAVWHVWKAG